MTLNPEFDPDETEYTTTTTNATNTITAEAEDEDATVEILNGETPVESGSAATWAEGDNVVTVKVTNGGESKTYTVTVHKPYAGKAITSFVVNTIEAEIDESDHTIKVTLPSGTEVTALEPKIETSEGATVDPSSEEATDFTNPVTYTVTAESGETQEYTVTVTVAEVI